MSSVPPVLKRQLRLELKEARCAYCHSPEKLLGLSLEVDHIIPTALGGKPVIGNLCLACRTCNGCKWQIVKGRDPLTNRSTKLFHPRRQKWTEHFEWSADGTHLIGLTATGRATIETLQMNNGLIVNLRSLWIILELHPAE